MVDRFVTGAVHRISPESPVPVLSVAGSTTFAGGAANVARNIAALGGHCTLIGVTGQDAAGRELQWLIDEAPGITASLVAVEGRPTTEKVRFVAQGQHMLRADSEDTSPVRAAVEAELLARLEHCLPGHDVLVLSDYAKGVLTDAVTTGAIALARKAGVPVVVDPKSPNFARYDGATVVTPNAREVQAATGINPADDALAALAGQKVLGETAIGAILITRAEKGMTLVTRRGMPLTILSRAREVADVVGAGDTVIATLALALGSGAELDQAAAIANSAAGIVVGKRGTATVSRTELIEALEAETRAGLAPPQVKVLPWAEARLRVEAWRRDGLKIGFTNGCFDILHIGHIALLDFARAHCDRLVVGLNSDPSIRRLKGPQRPVNAEGDRSLLLAALSVVDTVVLFDEDTPRELIDHLQPDVLVKGADYQISEIVGADTVLARGGEVLRFELVPGRSTTGTIERARRVANG
jgi:D-beta-D-heptose 7-phosphate kinase/D-beta-D-heptose 1-phosphate adenosyltransferase